MNLRGANWKNWCLSSTDKDWICFISADRTKFLDFQESYSDADKIKYQITNNKMAKILGSHV